LAEMLGHEVPSAEAARKFLYQFHDEAKIERAQQALPVNRVAYVPEESEPLAGVARVNEEVVRELGRRCPGAEDRHAGSGRHHHREREAGSPSDI
jgi:hypothetical protein